MMEFYKNEIDFNHREAQELNDRILTISVKNNNTHIDDLKILIKQKLKKFLIILKDIVDLVK